MPDANPGGPGGRRKKLQINKPMGKTSHRRSGGRSKLPMIVALVVAAVLLLWVFGIL